MSYAKLKELSSADLWAIRQFLDGKNKVLKKTGKYADEIKENQLMVSAISMVLNQRIEDLKQGFPKRKTND